MASLGMFAIVLFNGTRGERRLMLWACWIPLIYLFGDILKGATPTAVFHAGNLALVVTCVFILLCIPRLRANLLFTMVGLFSVYLMCLVPFSAYLGSSASSVLKVSASFMLLPIACMLFRSTSELKRLQAALIVTLAVAVIHFSIAQVFGIGIQLRSYENVYFAGGRVFVMYVIAYILVGIPLTLALLPKRRLLLRMVIAALVLAGTFVILRVFRRGTIVGLSAALFAYFLGTSRIHKRKLIRLASVAAVFALLAAPMYWPALRSIAAKRNIVQFLSNTERGRMAEFGLAVRMFQQGDLKHKLFGTDVLSSKEMLGVNRALHVDYTNITITAGVIGLLLYLAVLVAALIKFHRAARLIPDRTFRRLMIGTYWGTVALFLGLSASRQLGSTTALSLAFTVLGALIGVAEGTALQRNVPSPRREDMHADIEWRPHQPTSRS